MFKFLGKSVEKQSWTVHIHMVQVQDYLYGCGDSKGLENTAF
jgi:hypothetical protein